MLENGRIKIIRTLLRETLEFISDHEPRLNSVRTNFEVNRIIKPLVHSGAQVATASHWPL